MPSMRLQKALEARVCKEPGCEALVMSGQGYHRYCEDHHEPAARKGERTYPKVRKAEYLRPLSQIRADLAAQLTTKVRRFNSMVAHDRSTDPLEEL